MKERALSISLALAMTLLTACANDTPAYEETVITEDTAEVTENKLVPDIPSDLLFEGMSFRVLSSPYAPLGPILEDYDREAHADVLSEALYYRLIRTEERFGITMELNYGVEHQIAEAARSSINSGSDDYDLVTDLGQHTKSLVYEGLYTPISDLYYIDLEKPWWNKSYIESVSVNSENPYILFGSINYNNLDRSICTFFNIDLLETRAGMTEQEMYDLVIDGGWTFDKMTELSKEVYSDENGNTIKDGDDIFGFIHNNYWQVNFMAYSSGLKFTERDEDGLPVLALKNDRSIDLADKLIALFSPDNAAFNEPDNHKSVLLFGTGHGLFHINRFFVASWGELRDNNVNYGIIPPPKYDGSIEQYTSAIQETAHWHCVPITASETDFISAVLEYYAYEGYEYVIPAYYDVTLKFKYTRGDLDGASRMLDLIVANQYTDFMYVNTLGGMEKIFTQICQAGQNNFSSKYASLENTAKYHLRQYISELG